MWLISFIKSLFKKKPAKEVYYRYAELSEDAKAVARSAKNTEMVNIQEKLGWTTTLNLSKASLENSIHRFETYEHDNTCKLFKEDGSVLSIYTLDNIPVIDVERIVTQYVKGDRLYVEYKNKWKPGQCSYDTFIIDLNSIKNKE